MHKDILHLFYPALQTFSSRSWRFMTNPIKQHQEILAPITQAESVTKE